MGSRALISIGAFASALVAGAGAIAPPAHPLVAIGSYPNFATPDYKVKLTLEAKDEAALERAASALLAILDPTRLVTRV